MLSKRHLGFTLVYGALFFAFLYLAAFFNHTSGVSLWYPAAGFRLATLLVLGWRFVPGVLAGEIAAVMLYGALEPSTGFATLDGAIGAAVMPLTYGLAAFTLTRYADLDIRLCRFRDVAWIAAAAMVVPLVAATVNRLWQLAAGRLTIDAFLPSVVGFWIGDTIGILMLTPALLVWNENRRASSALATKSLGDKKPDRDPMHSPSMPSTAQLLLEFAAVWFFLILAYRLPEWLDAFDNNVHWYLAFIPVIWISFRHGLIGSIAGILAITTGAAWLTYLPVQSARFQELQIFVMFLASSGLLMGSVVSAMRRTERELKLQNRELHDARSQLEGQNEELETRNAEIERFTYAVSHDLKSPLVTIRGFLGLLEKDVAAGATDRMRHDMQRIKNATAKMNRVLDEVLDLSRVGRVINPPEEVPLGEVAREAVELVSGKISARQVKVEISPRLPVVQGDRLRLREALQNLIENAIQFLGEQPEPSIEIGARMDGEPVPVTYVRDNGIGIDPRYHERIFDLFERLDQQGGEGTGVGLALVQRIIELHGGRIWVESQGLGHGSTFCLALPGPPAEEDRRVQH